MTNKGKSTFEVGAKASPGSVRTPYGGYGKGKKSNDKLGRKLQQIKRDKQAPPVSVKKMPWDE